MFFHTPFEPHESCELSEDRKITIVNCNTVAANKRNTGEKKGRACLICPTVVLGCAVAGFKLCRKHKGLQSQTYKPLMTPAYFKPLSNLSNKL